MLISYNKMSELTGLDRRTIKSRLSGCEPKQIGSNRAHLFESQEALPIVYCLGSADDGTKLDGPEEKARLDKARRIAQELKNAEAEGELLPAADVEQILFRIIHAAKTKMLGVKSKVAPMVHDLIPDAATRHQILGAMDGEIRQALTELSQVDPDDFERAK